MTCLYSKTLTRPVAIVSPGKSHKTATGLFLDIYIIMQEETEEEYQQWRRECVLASRAGFKLLRQQPKNRYTNVGEYLADLSEMASSAKDHTLRQRYINFLADALSYWQQHPDNPLYQASKAAYEQC